MSKNPRKYPIDEKRLLEYISQGAGLRGDILAGMNETEQKEDPFAATEIHSKGKYKQDFLDPDTTLTNRKAVYVSRDTYEKLVAILEKISGRRVSLAQFCENIAAHHLRRYKDEINRINRELHDGDVY